MLPLGAADEDEVPGRHVQRVRPAVRGDDDVLDARAVPAVEVDARLDAEGIARLERPRVARNDVRVFVALETNPVAGSMDEVLPEARVGDDLAPCRVDVFRGDAPLAASVEACWADCRTSYRRRYSSVGP